MMRMAHPGIACTRANLCCDRAAAVAAAIFSAFDIAASLSSVADRASDPPARIRISSRPPSMAWNAAT